MNSRCSLFGAIIPAEHIAIVRSLLPPHTHRSVAAEHNLLLTHPEIVVASVGVGR